MSARPPSPPLPPARAHSHTPARPPLLAPSTLARFGGLNRSAADFFANLGSMVLVVLVAESWGLLLGGIFMQPKKAQV